MIALRNWDFQLKTLVLIQSNHNTFTLCSGGGRNSFFYAIVVEFILPSDENSK